MGWWFVAAVVHLELPIFRKLLLSSLAVAFSAVTSLAAEFGDLAGTYTGKTPKGNAIVIVVPKSGTPTYRFAGETVKVAKATLSGKTIRMNVGNKGLGKVVITWNGKRMAYKYSDNKGGTSTTLAKQ